MTGAGTSSYLLYPLRMKLAKANMVGEMSSLVGATVC